MRAFHLLQPAAATNREPLMFSSSSFPDEKAEAEGL
jgi:hypothetical protein